MSESRGNTVINIRGTSGSGKTTVIRGIMAMAGKVTPLGEDPKKPLGYHLEGVPGVDRPVYIVGPYENVCGGCDQIRTQDEICDRIRIYAETGGHVLVEGLLMSHSFARYAALDRELDPLGTHCIWGFLDTPLDVCLARVTDRREQKRLAKDNPPEAKPLNTKNTSDKHADNAEVYLKFLNARRDDWKLLPKFGYTGAPAKLDARLIPYLSATETVHQWLQSR